MFPKEAQTLQTLQTLMASKSRKNGLKKSLVFGMYFFIDFNRFLMDFRLQNRRFFVRFFWLKAKTAILQKYAFRLGGSTIFKDSSFEKSIKNWQKIDRKLRSETNALQSSKNPIFGAVLASPNHGFFEILAIKMKMVFCNEKQEKSTRPETSQIPPRAKAQRPVAWLLVDGLRE